MKKRNYAAVVLSAFAALSLMACSSQSAEKSTEGTTKAPETTAAESVKTEEPAESGTDQENGSEAAESYDGPEYEFKLGHVGAETHVDQKVADRFAELLDEKSGGKIKLTVYGNGQMGSLAELVDQLRYSDIDFAIINMPDAGNYYPDANVMSLPYLFTDFEHAERFFGTDAYQKLIADMAAETNIQVLGSFHDSFRSILTNKEIHSAADMNGVKIRVPDSNLYVQTFTSLGCNTTILPGSEVYQALQTGLVDATESSPIYQVSQNYYEVAKYFVRTNHIYAENSIAVSASLLASLDEKAQEIVREAAKTASEEAWAQAPADTEAAIKTMEEAGITLIEPDIASFQEAMAPIWDEYVSASKNGQEYIDAIKACAK